MKACVIFPLLALVYFGQHAVNKLTSLMCKIIEEKKLQLSKLALKGGISQ